MRRYWALALACVLAAVSASALAMGLGEIRLNSYLNQRLDAEIELVSAAADELESLRIGLADHQAFERYGLERSALLNTLQFRVVRRPNGTAYVKVTSEEPIREPFLTFLVEADWSRGRLLREYTVLLDPPTFAGREQQPAPAAAQAPAIEPVAPEQTARPAEPAVREEPAVAQPRVEETQTGDVVSIPPLEADAEQAAPIRREPAAESAPELGGTYGPIQRNETLWGIAQRLRPDESVTINQMMIALFRANPEAFQGNINRLKAGYILRVPEYGEITAIGRSEAFQDVKRQNEEWRYGTRPVEPVAQPEPETAEPELSLVAPEEDVLPEVGSGVGAGGEADDLGIGAAEPLEAGEDFEEDAVDLGVEAESPERMLDIEDESLQALQSQDELLETGDVLEDEAVLDEGAVIDETLAGEDLPAETIAPVDESPADEVEDIAAENATADEQAQQPVEDPRASAPAPVREPSLVERVKAVLLDPLGLGIGAALLAIVLVGFLLIRKRREAAQARAAAAMAEWDASADDADVTVVAGHGEDETEGETDVATVFAHGMEHEDTGTTRLEDDAEATQLLDQSDQTQVMQPADGNDEGTEDASAGADDFADTVFGGQTVTLDENDPLSEADFHMAYGLYDQAAEVVEKAVQRDPSRKDFHAKLAEIHFASNNTEGFLEAAKRLKELAGPGDSDWENVAIMGRQIAPDNPLFGESGSTSSVDLDFGSADEEAAGSEAAPASAADAGDSLDFDISLDAPGSEPEQGAGEPVLSDDEETLVGGDAGGLDFDFDMSEAGVDEAAPSDDAAAVGADSDAGDEFDFDLGELGGEESSDEEAALFSDDGSGGETAESAEPAIEFGGDDEATQTEFDKALQELSAFVDTNLPEQDAGDAVDAGEDAAGELNLDEYSFDQDSGVESADSLGTGEDEDDIGEIGTKLDLARAYIDMGDPDGARGILEEVIADGDEEQQKEARELLDQLA